MKTEWECIDLKCTHYDGDMCTLGFCEPDILEDNTMTYIKILFPHCSACGKYYWKSGELGYSTCCDERVCEGEDNKDREFKSEDGTVYCCLGAMMGGNR